MPKQTAPITAKTSITIGAAPTDSSIIVSLVDASNTAFNSIGIAIPKPAANINRIIESHLSLILPFSPHNPTSPADNIRAAA